MYHVVGTVLTLAFLAFFLFLISRMRLFRIGNIPIRWLQGAFLLKVLSGFFLYLIYTYYYTDRSTADIWKYYDDGMVMFSALPNHPLDYVQMLLGIGNDRERFTAYYDLMSHWDRPYSSSVANDTHAIIRFNAFIRLFSFGHYIIHSVVMNFLGLIGLTGIFHFLRELAPSKERWLFLGIFMMPGVVFWSSGVLKEPLLFFGLGMFLVAILSFAKDRLRVQTAILLPISLLVLFSVKSFALLAIFPGIVCWRMCFKWNRFNPILLTLAVYSALGIVGLLLTKWMPEKDIVAQLTKKQYEFYQLAEGGTYVQIPTGDTLYISASDYDAIGFLPDRDEAVMRQSVNAVDWQNAKEGEAEKFKIGENTQVHVLLDYGRTGSTIDIPRLDGSISSLIRATPMALINSLFRPFPWEIDSPFALLSGLENLMILLLIVLMVFNFDGSAVQNPVLPVAIMFALIILLLTGWVTPVVGAIVRYKVPALPFLISALLALTDTQKLEGVAVARFPFLRKYL